MGPESSLFSKTVDSIRQNFLTTIVEKGEKLFIFVKNELLTT